MKILLISHNVLSSYQNMGKTMATLFSGFSKSELCQFYIYPTLPELDMCPSYFRITDMDVLKSYYRFRVVGREYSYNDISKKNKNIFENKGNENFYSKMKHSALSILLRDCMWKFARWYTKELKNWIEREKPTHIFVAVGNFKFIYDIALKISKKYKIPIVTYICDDYYFIKSQKGILPSFQHRLLRKKLETLIKHSVSIITICDELKADYGKQFGKPITTIMTGTNLPIVAKAVPKKNITALSYFGNIEINRYLSLIEIGKALDSINLEKQCDYKLKIYTRIPERLKEVAEEFKSIKSIELCGFIVGQEFVEEFESAEMLVHVEAFDAESVETVKYSVSTKIGESLGSGKCLFAYGPSQVASIQHLLRNNCAYVVTQKSDLKTGLLSILFNEDLRTEIKNRAIDTARKFHDTNLISAKVREVFLNENCEDDIIDVNRNKSTV